MIKELLLLLVAFFKKNNLLKVRGYDQEHY